MPTCHRCRSPHRTRWRCRRTPGRLHTHVVHGCLGKARSSLFTALPARHCTAQAFFYIHDTTSVGPHFLRLLLLHDLTISRPTQTCVSWNRTGKTLLGGWVESRRSVASAGIEPKVSRALHSASRPFSLSIPPELEILLSNHPPTTRNHTRGTIRAFPPHEDCNHILPSRGSTRKILTRAGFLPTTWVSIHAPTS